MNSNKYYKLYKKYKSKYLQMKGGTEITIKIIVPGNAPKFGGLYNDANIYNKYLKNSKIVQDNDKDAEIQSDVNIFLELVRSAKILNTAKINIMMINQELLFINDSNKHIYQQLNIVLAKSKHAIDVLKKNRDRYNLKYKIYYTKHTTFYEPKEINPKDRNYEEFFHGAGKSRFKNTDVILNVWNKHKEYPKLYVTCFWSCYKNIKEYAKESIRNLNKMNNVELYQIPMDKDKLIDLKSKIVCHLCPSYKEGYGHYINEARISRSVVITVDGSPMNELIDNTCGILVKATEKTKDTNFSKSYHVTENDLSDAIKKYLELSVEDKIKMGNIAYEKYIEDTKFFEERINMLYEHLNNNTKIPLE